jgi:hypothetical protein
MLQARKSRVGVPMMPLNVFSLPNPFSRIMVLELTQPSADTSIRKCFWGVERGWHIRLTTSPPSVGSTTL